jgi:hypothetical protein
MGSGKVDYLRVLENVNAQSKAGSALFTRPMVCSQITFHPLCLLTL